VVLRPAPEEDTVAYDMTAAEAARRLGIKQATLYAYVSRGVLARARAADGRGSLFDADEVERLALRGRPRRPAGVADITVESAITELTTDRLRYRGRDVIELAGSRSLEEVAELLWAGELPLGAPRFPGWPEPPWQAPHIALTVGQAAQAALPDGTLPLERFQVIVPAMAATDPLRLQLDPAAVRAAGRVIVAGMVDCLPPQAARTGLSIAARLWSRLCSAGPSPARHPNPALLRTLSSALVLLADHELAASTLAARAAASVRADPYAVVATGLGALGGTLHGGSSLGVEALLVSAHGSPAEVPRVVGELLRRGERVPGFGHLVYRSGDPRAFALLDLVRRAAPKSAQLAVADALLAEVRQKSLPEPNIDFALATFTRVAGMVTGAAEAIFAVARTTGWIAHALEAYTTAPIRPRAVYTGP
jgi:citrate synthase